MHFSTIAEVSLAVAGLVQTQAYLFCINWQLLTCALQIGVQISQPAASQQHKLDQRLSELLRIPTSRVSEGLTPCILQPSSLNHD